MIAKRIAGAVVGAFVALGALSVAATPSRALAATSDETTDVQVMVAWYDEGHEDERPESVVAHLAAFGAEDDEMSADLTITADDEADVSSAGLEETPSALWAKPAEGLPRYSQFDEETGEGTEAEYYCCDLDIPDGYRIDFPETDDGTCLITCTYVTPEPYLWEVLVAHRWDDEGNEGARPDFITYRLLRDGEEIESMVMTAEDARYDMNGEEVEADPFVWTKAFATMVEEPWSEEEVDRDELFSHYSVVLDPIEGYTNGEVEGAIANKGNRYFFRSSASYVGVTEDEATNGGCATIRKKWNDEGHEDERPDSITIRLFKNGDEVDEKILSEDEADVRVIDGCTWWIWFDAFYLDETDDEGNLIEWSITEDDVEGYENTDIAFTEGKSYGWVIENTYRQETTEEPSYPEVEAPQTPAKPAQPQSPQPQSPQPTNLPQMGAMEQSVAATSVIAVASAIGFAISRRAKR